MKSVSCIVLPQWTAGWRDKVISHAGLLGWSTFGPFTLIHAAIRSAGQPPLLPDPSTVGPGAAKSLGTGRQLPI